MTIILDTLFWGLTLGAIGKVLLGVAVIFVHHKIVIEHKIDRKVLTQMRRESRLATIGILFIFAGYLLELLHFGYLSALFL